MFPKTKQKTAGAPGTSGMLVVRQDIIFEKTNTPAGSARDKRHAFIHNLQPSPYKIHEPHATNHRNDDLWGLGARSGLLMGCPLKGHPYCVK